MGRCRDCTWWEPFKPDDDYCEDWHEHRAGRGYCELTAMKDKAPEYPESLAWSEGSEPYRSQLVTTPDFGCVQFERKTD
jgi:hypothetical protein